MKTITATREYQSLTPGEKARLIKAFAEQEDRDLMQVLDQLLKMSCLILARGFEFNEEQLTLYLSNYRRVWNSYMNDHKRGIQTEKLDAQAAALFPSGGYPDYIFEGYFAHWPTKEGQK